jgi:hypothetical protein
MQRGLGLVSEARCVGHGGCTTDVVGLVLRDRGAKRCGRSCSLSHSRSDVKAFKRISRRNSMQRAKTRYLPSSN